MKTLLQPFLFIIFITFSVTSCTESDGIEDIIEALVDETDKENEDQEEDLADYIQITSASDLAKIGNNLLYPLNGNYYLANDITLSGEWSAIGESLYSTFSGTFNGGGHTITGLNLNDDDNYQGLFGYIAEATIKNLTLLNVTVNSSGDYIGALVGCAEKSIISSCAVVNGSVIGGDYVGGIIGYANESDIYSSYSTIAITGFNNVGGIAGCSSSKLVACYNTSSISGTSFVGGIVGDASEVIVSCYNTGNVNGTDKVGYIAGSTNSTATSCYYIDQSIDNATSATGDGSISATNTIISELNSATIIEDLNNSITVAGYSDVSYTAGECVVVDDAFTDYYYYHPNLFGEKIIYEGDLDEEDQPEPIVVISDNGEICIYTAAELAYIGTYNTYPLSSNYILMEDIVISDEWSPIGSSSSNYFGGSFDGNSHTISGLVINNSGSDYQGLFGYVKNATISNLIISNSSVVGGGYVGVVAGYANSSEIVNCAIAGGSISGDGNNVGGVVGYSLSSPITSCYNTASISGSDRVGGIVGYSSSSITSCYNTGSVVSSNSSVGGIAGSASSSSIISCYYIDQLYDSVIYITTGAITTLASLNSSEIIGEMNNATMSAGYSNVQYTSGTGDYLPSLMGESVQYEGDVYNLPEATRIEDKICIYTAAELSYIGVYATYLPNDNYILMNDIAIDGYWSPICPSSLNSFCGSFDGGNHTINGLTINNSSGDYQGLFGYIENATIQNLTISKPSIIGNGYIGTIAGYVKSNTNFKNCKIIECSITGNSDYVGGLVGYAYSTIIENCTIDSGYITGKSAYVGGIVGYIGSYSNVTTCNNAASIISTGDYYVGGIAGYTKYWSSINSSYNTGSIEVVSTRANYIGGIVGYHDSSEDIMYCWNKGSFEIVTTGTSTGANYIGGIIGYSDSPIKIVSCYNTGAMSIECRASGGRIGGIVGHSSGFSTSIISCYNTGSISCDNAGQVAGIVGYMGSYSSGSSITSCYNTGKVSSDATQFGYIVAYNKSNLASCYYFNLLGDDATSGVGLDYGSGESTAVNITTLNSDAVIDEMNVATSSAGYPDVKYTAGTGNYLPSLMGESILCE